MAHNLHARRSKSNMSEYLTGHLMPKEVMDQNIPYGRQNISEADIQAVVDVLRLDFLTQGSQPSLRLIRLSRTIAVRHMVWPSTVPRPHCTSLA